MAQEMIAVDELRTERREFRASVRAQTQFGIQLRKVARHIDDIMRSMAAGAAEDPARIAAVLRDYARALRPWAETTARLLHQEVARRNAQEWMAAGEAIGRGLAREIAETPVGHMTRTILEGQVDLITSLPREAAERVHELAMEARVGGQRPSALIDEIKNLGDITRNRAMLIARTEVARTASVITQARAQSAGSTHFVWRTSRDNNVRPSHRRLEGKIFRWDDPPISDLPDYRSLPGQIFRCRCTAQPILPD